MNEIKHNRPVDACLGDKSNSQISTGAAIAPFGRQSELFASRRNAHNEKALPAMNRPPKVGATAEERFQVAPEHLIDVANGGAPPVLSTPALIWFMEHSARNVLAPLLQADECSVGVLVNIEHLAATLSGAKVVCIAKVIYVDGPTVSFQLEAHDETELIARGTHKRRVVQVEKLAKRLSSKVRRNKPQGP